MNEHRMGICDECRQKFDDAVRATSLHDLANVVDGQFGGAECLAVAAVDLKVEKCRGHPSCFEVG
jgi:hypothetical protein